MIIKIEQISINKINQEIQRIKEGVFLESRENELAADIKKENKLLQSSLGLKEREANELKAQIRALETQLTEKENSGVGVVKIKRLEGKLEKVMSKIREWKELLQKRNVGH